MEFKQNAKYALVVPTSMGVRITPQHRQPVHVSRLFTMQATSAESNVLGVSASLGLKTKVLTTFVKDSPIARFIKDDLEAVAISNTRALRLSREAPGAIAISSISPTAATASAARA